MKYLIIILTVLFYSCNASHKAKSNLSNSKLVFFDDFANGSLDRSKWNVETDIHVNGELQEYVDSSATIGFFKGDAFGAVNGALELRPVFVPTFKGKDGGQYNFISGRINTQRKVETTYGKISARIKLTPGDGLWPAWWMLGNGEWPGTGEIDIMENVGDSRWINSAVHGPGYSGDKGPVNRLYFDGNDNITNWHIYAVEWTPDEMHFTCDGKTIFRQSKKDIVFKGKWSYDNPKYLILNFAVGGIYPFNVTGTKEPYYGLPLSTLEKIKKGECRMLVDWVKVEKL